ncbi:MAG: histidine ammonia-lyase [bacterium]|nr:histidine ammonia-lyase [bacterium]
MFKPFSMKPFLVGSTRHNLSDFIRAVRTDIPLVIDPAARKRIQKTRQIVENCTEPTYGINTGLGPLKDVHLSPEEQTLLSHNTLKSHAAGSGAPLPEEVSKLMLLLRIHALALGYSGVRVTLIEGLINLYEKKIFGVIYEHGSVGSSGDLCPLAHIALPLIGEGEVWENGRVVSAKKVLSKKGIRPFRLQSKEGLSLINGTQMMTAYSLLLIERGERLFQTADIIAALSLEALRGSRRPFHHFLHDRRPIPELQETAAILWDLLEGSEILHSHAHCGAVQDAYSLRCIPQVHGGAKIALNNLKRIIEKEVHAANDNPLIDPDSGEIYSGGNFHGEPLALALDYLGIALAKLANISERRTARLVDSHLSKLPLFLIEKPGVNSGFMIPQYTAAGIVSENKVLSHPASADSIPTSANQEDINSMGSVSAKKGMRILENAEQVLGIELMTSLQAFDISFIGQKRLKSSKKLEKIRQICRKEIPFLKKDTYLKPVIDQALGLVRRGLTA